MSHSGNDYQINGSETLFFRPGMVEGVTLPLFFFANNSRTKGSNATKFGIFSLDNYTSVAFLSGSHQVRLPGHVT